MSSPAMARSPQSPSAGTWVFEQMVAMFGRQVMATRWGVGEDLLASIDLLDRSLRRYHVDVIRRALKRCLDAGGTFPPSLPEFLADCRTADRDMADTQTARTLQIGTDAHIAAEDGQAVRDFRAQLGQLSRAKTQPPVRSASPRVDRAVAAEAAMAATREPGDYGGLPALMRLCAQAVGLAGGDEAQALRQIERRFAE